MLINISGSSGVGKTTVAHMFLIILSSKNKKVLHLSGDDLHKWDRSSLNWENITHLNSDANNLNLGKNQLMDLMNGSPIHRRIYNHESGKFDKPKKIKPPDMIINEGLHALYDDDVCKLADLNIFINTDKELKIEWKLNRDVESRGYTKDQVMLIMRTREIDEKNYICPQIKNADVVFNFSKKKYKTVDLNYKLITKSNDELLKKLKLFYELHKHFLLTSRSLSFEYDLIQGAGGNISYKFEDKIIISSSGYRMSDISMLNGYSVCNLSDLSIINDKQKKPSMELETHARIKEPIVLHTHPIYLNTILCSTESKEIISNILHDYTYIPYCSPGKELNDNFPDEYNKTILLENHGLIYCGGSFDEVLNSSLKINKLCKDWLIRNAKTFTSYSTKYEKDKIDRFLFPDSVVLTEENNSINNYIILIQKEAGLIPKYLNSIEIDKIRNMNSENYRKSLT
ncbi:MAG: class II aldolase/adducin family protein [Bacteroidetes bacterium]|nr:class II aldolase/adducin family protein [Bacteroidota bacterium]